LAYLQGLELHHREDLKATVSYDANGRPELFAFVWVDRDRRYFVCNGANLEAVEPILRTRTRQVNTTPNAEAERVHLEIPQPKATQVYYQTCGSIDSHNRKRQDDLDIEKTIRTHSWDKRTNLTVFGMCVVDAYLVYAACTQYTESQDEFYSGLAEEMIDNTIDFVATRGRARGTKANDDRCVPTFDSFSKEKKEERWNTDKQYTPRKLQVGRMQKKHYLVVQHVPKE
jgi:hypothetical protein